MSWLGVAIGFFARMIHRGIWPSLSIVHELFHATAAQFTGGVVTRLEWTYTGFIGGNEPLFYAAGYYGELFLYAALAIWLPKRWIGKIAGGSFIWLVLEAPLKTGTSDFEKLSGWWPEATMVWVILWALLAVAVAARFVEGEREQAKDEAVPRAAARPVRNNH